MVKRIEKFLVRACALLLVACLIPGAAAAREVIWSAARPLTWADFTGPVARAAAPDNVAVTTASLVWTYEYDVQRSGGRCAYRILDIRSEAVFDGTRSWVRPGHRTAAVLAHEQGHFDITQIHKLAFERAVRDLIGTSDPCRGRSMRRASAEAQTAIAGIVKPIYERIWREHMRLQAAYDTDTRHGIDAEAQRRWLERIAEGLRRGSWDTRAGG